ncbi:DUF6243 family protein [Streptomyces fungicidicus]|uniref:DUF6243 family protein n=1 Tax=Streptomyces fungicidicus TaxID=68203 RepID=UPI003F4CBA56
MERGTCWASVARGSTWGARRCAVVGAGGRVGAAGLDAQAQKRELLRRLREERAGGKGESGES